MKRAAIILTLLAASAAFFVPATATSGESLHVLVLLAYYQDTAPTPLTPAQAWANFDANVAAYYRQESYGLATISGEGHGWYQVPCQAASCSMTTATNGANAAAQADGVNIAAFDHIIYMFSGGVPSVCGGIACGGGSLANGQVWGSPNVVTSADTGQHEFGHAIGLNHTDFLGPVGGQGGWSQLPVAQLSQLGWLDVPEATTGTYTLIDPGSLSGLRGLQIQRGDGTRLVLDYRSSGLYVESDTGQFFAYVYKLQADPCGGFQLQPQHQWWDSVSHTLIQLAAGGQVTVTLNAADPGPPPPDLTPPTAPSGLIASKQGNRLNLAWDTSTDDGCPPITYHIYRNGSEIGTTTGSQWQDTPPRRTTVTYTVKANDPAGNLSAASNAVTANA